MRTILFLQAICLSLGPAALAASQSAAPLRLDELRRVTDSEFRQSLMGADILFHSPDYELSHPEIETFLPFGRYAHYTWPSRSFGTYELRKGLLCVHLPGWSVPRACRVLLTDGHGRFFSRGAPSGDHGEGPLFDLRITRPGLRPTEGLRRLSQAEFDAAVNNATVWTDYPDVENDSHPEYDTYIPGGRAIRHSGPLRFQATYKFSEGVLCVTDDARPFQPRCDVLFTDGHGRYFSRHSRGVFDADGDGPVGELRIERPALDER